MFAPTTALCLDWGADAQPLHALLRVRQRALIRRPLAGLAEVLLTEALTTRAGLRYTRAGFGRVAHQLAGSLPSLCAALGGFRREGGSTAEEQAAVRDVFNRVAHWRWAKIKAASLVIDLQQQTIEGLSWPRTHAVAAEDTLTMTQTLLGTRQYRLQAARWEEGAFYFFLAAERPALHRAAEAFGRGILVEGSDNGGPAFAATPFWCRQADHAFWLAPTARECRLYYRQVPPLRRVASAWFLARCLRRVVAQPLDVLGFARALAEARQRPLGKGERVDNSRTLLLKYLCPPADLPRELTEGFLRQLLVRRPRESLPGSQRWSRYDLAEVAGQWSWRQPRAYLLLKLARFGYQQLFTP